MGALLSLTSAAVQPVWGILCDRYHCHRVFYVLSSIATPLLYLWIIRSSSVWELMVCALLSGMFINCIQNMGNGWIASLNVSGCRINYGAARSCGSLAFAVMAVIQGQIIRQWGMYGLVVGMAGCGAVCTLAACSLPKGSQSRSTEESRPSLREGLSMLITQRDYMVLILCGFLATFGVAGLAAYYTVHLANMGAGAVVIGIGTFAYAIAEVPFLFLFERLVRRVDFRKLVTVCLLCHSLQCALVGLSPNYVCAILCMVLQGPSFGTLVPCLQKYSAEHIPAKYVSTAQLFSSSISLSASMIFGNLTASALSRSLSLRGTFLVMSLISFLGFAIFVLYHLKTRRTAVC